MASLRFTTGVWAGREIALREPEARIGRDPVVDIVIPPEDQRFVSRVHAAIITDGTRSVLRDLDSSNGTWVNGRRVQEATLADGDEIQFGRKGPVARYYGGATRAETVFEGGNAGRIGSAGRVESAGYRPPAPAARVHPPQQPVSTSPTEAPSQIVRRVVNEAMAANARRSRRRMATVVVCLVVAGAGAVWGAVRYGVLDWNDRIFRRLADDYQDRVVLVEVGVIYNGRYSPTGNGTGFFAADGGYIVTNKHVIHTHLYDQRMACLAESFRRHGRPYEQSLVITVWPGGSQFRQTPNTPSGDRGLGYSTEHGTLALSATAPDNLLPPQEIECADSLGGPPFRFGWRRHSMDNNDLAVLRATKSVESIPLAETEPEADAPVMVYGFPTGTIPLETNKAEPIRRVGHVLRTRETIQIDAVVLGGNSGGPLIDADGNVVGITTRGTAESLNMAIKVEYAKRLLERARSTP